ncbi:MAG: hypothetical protein M1812_003741 [Candelaria pacifica]|nr:MAG: hypothetical protein M1812_003741 [Candelaria pacifica]
MANHGVPAPVFLHAAQPWAVPPRRNPTNPLDHTSFHPNERLWSANRLPVVLGQLEPHSNWRNPPMTPIAALLDSGNPVLDGNGNAVREFWFLPRHLASWRYLWRAEAYFRLDRRLTYKDLWARMVPNTPYRLNNSFNNRRARNVRGPLNMFSWEPRQSQSRAMVEALENLTPRQLAHNTSWDVLPQGIGQPLLNTKYPGLLSTGLLPLNYFNRGQNIQFPSQRTEESLNELARIQDLAYDQGLNHWKELDPSDQNPAWWARRSSAGTGAVSGLAAPNATASAAGAPVALAPSSLPAPPQANPPPPSIPQTQAGPQGPSSQVGEQDSSVNPVASETEDSKMLQASFIDSPDDADIDMGHAT